MSATAVSHEQACRRVASHFSERWLRHYAASKLRRDAVFATAYELLRDSTAPILDLGCGVGLLAFYLRERGFTQPIIGLDIDERKIQRARAIAAAHYDALTFVKRDASDQLPDFNGNVTLFDVLHYVPRTQQDGFLRAAAEGVSPGGCLLLRDCVHDASLRFWITCWLERFAQLVTWNVKVPFHFVTREMINASFVPNEFTRAEPAMVGGGPFNNYLFIFRRQPAAVAPLAG